MTDTMAPTESDPPADGSPASRAALRVPLLVALLVSAAGALLVQPRIVSKVRAEELEAGWVVVVPAVFALVLILAAIDAWRTARRRGYFRGPSVVAIAAGIAFLGLLLPSTLSEYRARTSPALETVEHYRLLAKPRDPRVRALVMEAAGFRPGSADEVKAILLSGLDDADPLVVRAAVAAVSHRAGVPLSGTSANAQAKRIAESWTAP
jgi:hypothetical protein